MNRADAWEGNEEWRKDQTDRAKRAKRAKDAAEAWDRWMRLGTGTLGDLALAAEQVEGLRALVKELSCALEEATIKPHTREERTQ